MCGIICVYSPKGLNTSIMSNISHRGHDSYGISYFHKRRIINYYNQGKVDSNKLLEIGKEINSNKGLYYIGHTRYSTSGNSTRSQPFNGTTTINNKGQDYILVHNGNISNRKALYKLYKCDISESLTDTEILVNIINNMKQNNWYEILQEILSKILGVYCIMIGVADKIYILRDTYGVRPLCLCRNNKTNSLCVISEDNNLIEDGYTFVKNIKPGTIGMVDKNGYREIYSKFNYFTPCSLEYIYFLNQKSNTDNVNVENFRYRCGVELSKGDTFYDYNDIIVSGIPETGIISGLGFADSLDLNYQQVIKKKEEGRTFILKNNEERRKAITQKFAISDIIKNKTLILVDDSLVRGNTLKILIEQCKSFGVKEVHIRIVSPPVISECYYGIDIPTKEELIASKMSVDEIKEYIGCDSLKYLDIKSMIDILPNKNACTSCFTGNYNNSLLDW